MTDNRLPATMSFEDAEDLFPFMIMSDKTDRLMPNSDLCSPTVPAYEWIWDEVGRYGGYFRALPRTGGRMAPIVEAANA